MVSFLIAGLLVRDVPRSRAHPQIVLLVHSLGRLIARPGLELALALFGLAVFIVTIVAGFRGNQNPYRNIAPTIVWIIWWVGLAYVSAFVGNLWALINPWRTIFESVETIYRGVTNKPALSLRLSYPEGLGVWPACILLLAFSWTELIYPSPAVPLHIAWLAVGYSILTFIGMFVFGRETWLAHGEVFTLVFGTFARLRPTAGRSATMRIVASAIRRRAARQQLGFHIDDGLRAAAALERSLRRRARHPGMGPPGKYAGGVDSGFR